MRFNLTVVDPPGYPYSHFLFDVVRLLQGGLEDLGHPCSITRNKTDGGALNILVGVHLIPTRDYVKDILATGHRYVVLQTEIVRGHTFNQEAGSRFDDIFLPLARGAVGVWDSSDLNIAALKKFGIEAGLLGWGYAHAVEEIRHKTDRDIDFFFYGSITPRRRTVLQKLDELGYKVIAAFDAAPIYRNDLIARSEVLLTIRQSDAMAHLPWGRILYLVNNRCLVAGETGSEQQPLEDLFLWAEPPQAIELLRTTRARTDRRALAQEFYDRFRTRPMSGYLAPLLDNLRRAL